MRGAMDGADGRDSSRGSPCRRRQIGAGDAALQAAPIAEAGEDNGDRKPQAPGDRLPAGAFPRPHGETIKNYRSVGESDHRISTSRPAYTVPQLRQDFCYQPKHDEGLVSTACRYLRSCCHCSASSLWTMLLLRVPILAWLPQYSVSKDLTGDIIAGCTVAVMHLPQGMAYAMLAEVPPILGLYTAFFPVLAYALLGTSRHVSMGTFAVACLMTGKIVGDLSTPIVEQTGIDPSTLLGSTNGTAVDYVKALEYITENDDFALANSSVFSIHQQPSNADSILSSNLTLSGSLGSTTGQAGVTEFSPIQVCVAVSFIVGVWQIVFGLLQLGQLCVFLSEMLISGFTTGAACHVFSSQVKHLLGVPVQRYSGPFRLIYTYIEMIQNISSCNLAALAISAVCITMLVFNNEFLKPRVKKYTNFPVPIEMIVVIVGTIVAYFFGLEETRQLKVVGDIPTGLPEPEVPDYHLFLPVLKDSFTLAIVVYVISFSMAKIFTKKHGYQVDATQELYAGGLSNIFGSMFSSVPSSASMSRSLIQESVGGRTQVTSLISCSGILVILLFVGPVFESLPTCVLASIIVVALKGMFMQVYDFLKMWKQSKADSMMWLITFLVTVLVDIDYGLATGVLVSLILLVKRNNVPVVTKLGWVPNTDIYLDINTYQSAVQISGTSICRVYGSLQFANCDKFRTTIANITGVDVAAIMAAKVKHDRASEVKDTTGHQPDNDDAVQQQRPPTAVSTPNNQDRAEDSCKTKRKNEHVIIIDTTNRNLTKEVIREAIINTFRRKTSSTSGNEGKKLQKREPMGQQNPSFIPDEPLQFAPAKDNPFALLKTGFLTTSSKVMHTNLTVSVVVLCMAAVSWVDVAAAKQIAALVSDYSAAGVVVALAAVNDSVMDVLRKSGAFARIPENRFFHTIHDAVTCLVPLVGGSAGQRRDFGDTAGRRHVVSATEDVPGSKHDDRPALLQLSTRHSTGPQHGSGQPHGATYGKLPYDNRHDEPPQTEVHLTRPAAGQHSASAKGTPAPSTVVLPQDLTGSSEQHGNGNTGEVVKSRRNSDTVIIGSSFS